MRNLIVGLTMAVITNAVASEQTTKSVSVQNSLTPAGNAAWTIENLGPQVTLSTVMSTAVDPGNNTRPATAYFSVMGEPGKLVVVDFSTAKVQKELPLPSGQGSYGMRIASDGKLYMASHSGGILYRYTPGSDNIETLGKPADHVTFIWDIVEGTPGKIYGGCYPQSTLFEYDIATGKFRDLGPAKEGEDYARTLAWDSTSNKLYVGIGSHADIIEIDPATNSRRSILPDTEVYKKSAFVYSVGAVKGSVIARIDPGNKAVIIDAANAREIIAMPVMTGSLISPPGPDGKVYFSGDGKLQVYDPDAKEGKDTGYAIRGDIRGFAWSADKKTLLMATTGKNVQQYTPSTNVGSRQYCELPPQPLHIQNIIPGPDGKIYSSGYVSGQLGILDPATGEHVQHGNAKQAEGMTFYKDQLYLGTYPKANLTIFDTSRPAGEDNPYTVFNLHNEQQDRPFGMLAVPEIEKVYMGTVPGYGILGGALAVITPGTSTPQVHRNLINDQGIVTLAYRDGILYGGTTIFGGLGVDPTAKEAKLFLWDANIGELKHELVPVEGKRGISGLQFGPDGNLWGWAEDSLFVFDPKTRKVIYSKRLFTVNEEPRHFWRGGTMTEPVDGVFYGAAYGKIFSVDAATKEFTILADGGYEILKRDTHGDLYVIRKEDLVRLRKKQSDAAVGKTDYPD